MFLFALISEMGMGNANKLFGNGNEQTFALQSVLVTPVCCRLISNKRCPSNANSFLRSVYILSNTFSVGSVGKTTSVFFLDRIQQSYSDTDVIFMILSFCLN